MAIQKLANGEKVYFINICNIVVITYKIMAKNEIQIKDSYKSHPELEAPYESHRKDLELRFANQLSFKLSILYNANNKSIRVHEIKASNVEKSFGSKVSVNISTNNSIYDGIQSIRITINMSASNIFKSEVGSSVIKLTPKGDCIQYSKTDNVSDFKVIQMTSSQ